MKEINTIIIIETQPRWAGFTEITDHFKSELMPILDWNRWSERCGFCNSEFNHFRINRSTYFTENQNHTNGIESF